MLIYFICTTPVVLSAHAIITIIPSWFRIVCNSFISFLIALRRPDAGHTNTHTHAVNWFRALFQQHQFLNRITDICICTSNKHTASFAHICRRHPSPPKSHICEITTDIHSSNTVSTVIGKRHIRLQHGCQHRQHVYPTNSWTLSKCIIRKHNCALFA